MIFVRKKTFLWAIKIFFLSELMPFKGNLNSDRSKKKFLLELAFSYGVSSFKSKYYT